MFVSFIKRSTLHASFIITQGSRLSLLVTNFRLKAEGSLLRPKARDIGVGIAEVTSLGVNSEPMCPRMHGNRVLNTVSKCVGTCGVVVAADTGHVVYLSVLGEGLFAVRKHPGLSFVILRIKR